MEATIISDAKSHLTGKLCIAAPQPPSLPPQHYKKVQIRKQRKNDDINDAAQMMSIRV